MFSNKQVIIVKTEKTLLLMGLVNLVVSPFYFFNTNLAIPITTLLNAALLYQLHELGKNRRPIANAVQKVDSFFSRKQVATTLETENSMRNIINGGAAVIDVMSELCENKFRS